LEDLISKRNKYGKTDLTPFNVFCNNYQDPYLGGITYGFYVDKKVKKPEFKLTPQDVIDQLLRLGFSVKPKTLQRRYQDELIPRPFMKGGGRGKGTIVLYPDDTPAEFYASEHLKDKLGINFKEVAEIRQIALQGDKKAFWTNICKNPKNYAAYVWLVFKAKALGQRLPIVVISKKPINPEGITQRTIELELFPVVNHPALEEGIPDGYDFLEILNPVTLTEGETPNFDEWWKMLVKLETNI
jgi:hypothetical protein